MAVVKALSSRGKIKSSQTIEEIPFLNQSVQCHVTPVASPVKIVPAASDFAAYNEISAAYFTLKFINNKC